MKKSDLKKILQERNLAPNKRLSQCFLCDLAMIQKICALFNKDDIVLEIGPGLGALTFPLCEKIKKLICVEIDKGCVAYLQEQKKEFFLDSLEIIHEDVLKFDFKRKFPKEKISVCGNLPYSLTGPILMMLLEHRDQINRAVIMVQKEVGERLIAKPGTKLYGKISVFYQMFANIKTVSYVPKQCFYPAPKVDSIILDIQFKNNIHLKNEEKFFEIVKCAFLQRRKKLINALEKFDKKNIEKILEKHGLKIDARPENLSYNEYAFLAEEIEK